MRTMDIIYTINIRLQKAERRRLTRDPREEHGSEFPGASLYLTYPKLHAEEAVTQTCQWAQAENKPQEWPARSSQRIRKGAT